jgi:hypothetical protein
MLPSKSSSLRQELCAFFGRSRASSKHSLADVEADLCRHAKFVAEAWKSRKTLEIISRIAGIDLVPVIDYEIGHINISIPGAIKKEKDGVIIAEENGKAVVGWHRDSYPFVCVLMMSDTTGMVGGETALKTGTGGVMKVRGPTKVN